MNDTYELKNFFEAMIPEIHQNAIEHGWWDGERTNVEIYSLFHSELSEALEEYRMARPNCYIVGKYGIQIAGFGDDPDAKPEGVAVELADYIIRVLDYFGVRSWGMEEFEIYQKAYLESKIDLRNETVPRVIANAHYATSLAFGYSDNKEDFLEKCMLTTAMIWISKWFEANSLDVQSVIRIKHAHNKTRPYKHGGKRI